MIHAVASRLIRAPRADVRALYVHHEGWPQLFPRTVRSTRLVCSSGNIRILEVEHAIGAMRTVMTLVSPDEVRLEQWKPHHDARFVHHFEPVPQGTLYTVIADVSVTTLRALEPVAAASVRFLVRRYVLEPVASASERTRAAAPRLGSPQISWGIGRRGARKYRSGEYGPKFDTRDV